MQRIFNLFHNHLLDTWHTAWKVLKIIIPVTIIVKIFDLLGFIEVIGSWLAPLMTFIGLPESFGLVCATTACASLYSGIYVFLNYVDNTMLTQAQVTVLATMMLIAHSLPIELEVAFKVGVKRWFMLLIRLFALISAGFLQNKILISGNWLQNKNISILPKSPQKMEFIWYKWAIEQLQNYLMIVVIIFLILLIMRLLKYFGIIQYLQNKLEPFLGTLGMGQEILPMTLVGLIMGLVFGSALIIKEKDENPTIDTRNFVYAMVFLGLCHAIIEDTLLVLGIGASIWGVLFFRIVFSYLFTFIFVKISQTSIFKGKILWISK